MASSAWSSALDDGVLASCLRVRRSRAARRATPRCTASIAPSRRRRRAGRPTWTASAAAVGVPQRVGEVEEQLHCAPEEFDRRHLAAVGVRGRRAASSLRVKVPSHVSQSLPHWLGQPEVVGRDQRLVPRADRERGSVVRPVEFGVALPQQRERVLVGTEPDVQAMFFDPAVRPRGWRRPCRPSRQPRW